ncbi:restriction endonuclease subunit S, partial [Nostoc sp. NIES-2111]
MIQADTLKPGWKLVKFGDVVRLSKDRAANPEAEGIERYVGLEHIDPDDLRIRRWGLVAEGTTFTSKFKPGQVLFGKRRAYQRKVAVADFEGVCSGDIYVFESANPKVLLPELLPFICQTDRFFEYAVGTSAGSLSPRTNWTSLANFQLALPPLEEQHKITLLLSSAEKAFESQKTLLAAMNNVHTSLAASIAEEGTGFIRFREKIKIQSGWKIIKLSDICSDIVDCLHRTPNYINDCDDSIPAIRTTDVSDGEINLIQAKRVSLAEYITQISRLEPRPDDILYSREAPMGHAALVPKETKLCISQRMMHLRTLPNVNPVFVMEVLNSPFVRDQVERLASGSTVRHINVADVKRLMIPIP